MEVKEVESTKRNVDLRLELVEGGEDKECVVMGTWCKNES